MKKTIVVEPQFQLTLQVGASMVGQILAFLDNRAEVGINLIKEVKPGKNFPRGAMKEALIETIKKNGGKMKLVELRKILREKGFSKASVSNINFQPAFKKYLNINKITKTVTLLKGVE